MLGWLLTTTGTTTRIVAPDCAGIRAEIEAVLGTDLIGCTPVAPGVDIWKDLLALSTGKPLNAAALGFIDTLCGPSAYYLPRIHGDIVIASHDDLGGPTGIESLGLVTLRAYFMPREARKTFLPAEHRKIE